MATTLVTWTAISAAAPTIVSLEKADEADPDHLAREQAAGLDRCEQDLHHPRRLLLDHALGDHVPVLAERDPEHDAEGQAGEEVLGVLGIWGLQGLDLSLGPAHRGDDDREWHAGGGEARLQDGHEEGCADRRWD